MRFAGFRDHARSAAIRGAIIAVRERRQQRQRRFDCRRELPAVVPERAEMVEDVLASCCVLMPLGRLMVVPAAVLTMFKPQPALTLISFRRTISMIIFQSSALTGSPGRTFCSRFLSTWPYPVMRGGSHVLLLL